MYQKVFRNVLVHEKRKGAQLERGQAIYVRQIL